MNLDLATIKRSYYSLLDCLSDVGGLMSVVLESVAVVLMILNYQHLENYMTVNLFKLETKFKTDQQIKPPRCANIADYFINLLPGGLRCSCCKKSSLNDRALEKARDQLGAETNVIDLVKNIRFF